MLFSVSPFNVWNRLMQGLVLSACFTAGFSLAYAQAAEVSGIHLQNSDQQVVIQLDVDGPQGYKIAKSTPGLVELTLPNAALPAAFQHDGLPPITNDNLGITARGFQKGNGVQIILMRSGTAQKPFVVQMNRVAPSKSHRGNDRHEQTAALKPNSLLALMKPDKQTVRGLYEVNYAEVDATKAVKTLAYHQSNHSVSALATEAPSKVTKAAPETKKTSKSATSVVAKADAPKRVAQAKDTKTSKSADQATKPTPVVRVKPASAAPDNTVAQASGNPKLPDGKAQPPGSKVIGFDGTAIVGSSDDENLYAADGIDRKNETSEYFDYETNKNQHPWTKIDPRYEDPGQMTAEFSWSIVWWTLGLIAGLALFFMVASILLAFARAGAQAGRDRSPYLMPAFAGIPTQPFNPEPSMAGGSYFPSAQEVDDAAAQYHAQVQPAGGQTVLVASPAQPVDDDTYLEEAYDDVDPSQGWDDDDDDDDDDPSGGARGPSASFSEVISSASAAAASSTGSVSAQVESSSPSAPVTSSNAVSGVSVPFEQSPAANTYATRLRHSMNSKASPYATQPIRLSSATAFNQVSNVGDGKTYTNTEAAYDRFMNA